MLRRIAVAAGKEPDDGCCSPEDYGAEVDNAVFLMKPYCWCDREGECPWCTGCRVYQTEGSCAVCVDPALSLEQRRAAAADQRCDYSAGRGIFTRFAPWTIDRVRDYYDPPNFWHKPTNFRVTWYKYIGRDTTTNVPETDELLARIEAECLGSL